MSGARGARPPTLPYWQTFAVQTCEAHWESTEQGWPGISAQTIIAMLQV
jgi:hypothetical protein